MKANILSTIIILIFIFSACEEIMDIKFDSDDNYRLVVDGRITSDTTSHIVILSRTGDFFKKEPQIMETGATVTISDGFDIFELTETDSGIYKTDTNVYGQIGYEYSLDILLQNGQNYHAAESIRPLLDIDSITVTDTSGMHNFGNITGDGYVVKYFGWEKPGKGDHYQWQLYLDNELYTDTIFETLFSNDDFINGNYIYDIPMFFIKDEDITKDTTKITLAMYSISRRYYDFLVGLMLETVWRGSPWDGPPANVPSNISNNALGFFVASDVRRVDYYLIRKE